MKYTLLDLVQTLSSSLGGDEVNSIGDTIYGQDLAKIVRTAYFTIISRAQLPEHYDVFELEPSLDPTKPTLMYRPDYVKNIQWLKYNKITSDGTSIDFQPVYYKDVPSFLDYMYAQDSSANNVGTFTHTIGTSSITFLYINDRAPQYFTSFDDNSIIFDSYDAAVDDTLQKTKSLGYGLTVPNFLLTDTFVPDLDDEQFDLLLNEAKSLAFLEMKQTIHPKAEKNARRGWVHLQASQNSIPAGNGIVPTTKYGRK